MYIMGFVRQNEGIHFRYLCHLSPIIYVVSMHLIIKVAIAPIPATTK